MKLIAYGYFIAYVFELFLLLIAETKKGNHEKLKNISLCESL